MPLPRQRRIAGLLEAYLGYGLEKVEPETANRDQHAERLHFFEVRVSPFNTPPDTAQEIFRAFAGNPQQQPYELV